MTKSNWVPLTEYSNKYQVSISTLRRRIRAERVEYITEDGKYLLKDLPLTDHHTNKHREGKIVPTMPSSTSLGLTQELPPPSAQPVSSLPPQIMRPVEAQSMNNSNKDNPSHMTYLNEIKKAYSLILQEKEEQVLILKDEVADLQTLVKVLESENQRIQLELKKSKINTETKSPSIIATESLYESDWSTDLELE